jgi:hypothetical protein
MIDHQVVAAHDQLHVGLRPRDDVSPASTAPIADDRPLTERSGNLRKRPVLALPGGASMDFTGRGGDGL